jgi:hypothetical protein
MAGRSNELPRPIDRDGFLHRGDVDIRVTLYARNSQRTSAEPGEMPIELAVTSHSRRGAFVPKRRNTGSRPGLSPKPPVGLLSAEGAHPL